MDTRKLTSRPGHEPHNQASIYAEDGAGRDVGLTYDDHDGKTAAELVRRWNAYPFMLAALEAICDLPADDQGQRTIPAGYLDQARAAIANATNTH